MLLFHYSETFLSYINFVIFVWKRARHNLVPQGELYFYPCVSIGLSNSIRDLDVEM